MGREVRRVTTNWEHPKGENGRYVPLFNGLCEALTEYYRDKAMWEAGYRRDWSATPEMAWKEIEVEHENDALSEWIGEPPSPEDYMPDWAPEIRTHLQMYEDTTEGTPISPVMETAEDLARWLADNEASSFGDMTATYDQWLDTINRGFAFSAVMSGGVMESGVAAMAEIEA